MTGINVYLSITAIFVVCIFYTVVVSITILLVLLSPRRQPKKNIISLSGRNESSDVDRYIAGHHHVRLYDRGKNVEHAANVIKNNYGLCSLFISNQVVIKGHVDVGGLSAVWNANQVTGRVEFDEYV